MAAVTGAFWDTSSLWQASTNAPVKITSYAPTVGMYQTLSEGSVNRIFMKWLDVDAGGTVYREWEVVDVADPNGLLYKGTKSGTTPITNAFVSYRINQ